jgi:hypothetical protein
MFKMWCSDRHENVLTAKTNSNDITKCQNPIT